MTQLLTNYVYIRQSLVNTFFVSYNYLCCRTYFCGGD